MQKQVFIKCCHPFPFQPLTTLSVDICKEDIFYRNGLIYLIQIDMFFSFY